VLLSTGERKKLQDKQVLFEGKNSDTRYGGKKRNWEKIEFQFGRIDLQNRIFQLKKNML
jgi:hypothetical protein